MSNYLNVHDYYVRIFLHLLFLLDFHVISGPQLYPNEDISSPEEVNDDKYSVPPVGNSPVKHSPLLTKRENNQEFIRQKINPKTSEVIQYMY